MIGGAVFAKVVPLVMLNEGGDNDGKNDYGGHTRFGISKRAYPKLDLDALTQDQALKLLELNYWDEYKLGRIKDQTIANQVFLLIINMNPLHAGRIVQLAINDCGRGIVTVKMDGIIGSKTIDGINLLDEQCISDRVRIRACEYYLREADNDTNQAPNFRGWIRRALA